MQMPDTHWDRLPESERQRIHDECGGERLPPEVVERGLKLFNEDLSAVRVHRSGAAEQAAMQLRTEAYVRGNDIYLGRADPGLHTAAHEAVHVIAQPRGLPPSKAEAQRHAELLTRALGDVSSWRR
jgi:hypothetical protein